MNVTKMRWLSTPLTFALAIFALVASAFGQHYTPGTEGIRAATLPPPGVYLRDDNLFYWADTTVFYPSPMRREFTYLNEPRLIWITSQKILGADYGMDLIVPFGYSEVEHLVRRGRPQWERASTFGLGDMQFEPVLLSWHLKQFDFTAGYAFWAPTGDFDENEVVNIGKGFWTHMFTAGLTWYPEKQKSWAVSVLNHYEVNTGYSTVGTLPSGRLADQDNTPGQTYTLEWGLSKTLSTNLELGVIGYYQQQVTGNEGPRLSPDKFNVVGIGPEIRVNCPKLALVSSLRYAHEVASQNHTEGDTVAFTLTRKF